MKRSKLNVLLLLPTLLLGVCNNNNEPSLPVVDDYKDKLPSAMDGGVILHAFGWKYTDIEKNLESIARSGYKMVQTLPVQQPKNSGSWWAFYQPLSFSIGDNSPLGTKEELKHLCEAADEYGVKIVVDVVANHMANNGKILADGLPGVNESVADYEPDIYNDMTNTFHHVTSGNDCADYTQRYAYGDLPDLNTSNSIVQGRVLSLLKECIDVGVDGFRFDAAKHIETPRDPIAASDFWDKTLEVAKDYYKELNDGDDLYAYGEILNEVGGSRDISYYTDYMDVTANGFGETVKSAVIGKNPQKYIDAGQDYGRGSDLNKIVTWVESHDTYCSAIENGNTLLTERRVGQQWALVASRQGTQPLFFARTDSNISIGKVSSYHFEDPTVAAVNKFHNRFIGADEELLSNEKVITVERFSDDDVGAVIVNLNSAGNYKASFKNLEDGSYYDQISGRIVTIKKGVANVEFDSNAVVVLTRSAYQDIPTVSISEYDGSYVESKKITVTVNKATESYYQINEGEKVYFEGTAEITLDKTYAADTNINIKVTAISGDEIVTKSGDFKRFVLIEGGFNIIGLNPTYLTDYELYFWIWPKNGNGRYFNTYTLSEDGKVLLVNFPTDVSNFLIALFPKEYTVTKLNTWDENTVKQSPDYVISTGYLDASAF